MDEAGGQNDSGGKSFDDEEDVLVRTKRLYPHAKRGNTHPDATTNHDGNYRCDLERKGLLLVAVSVVGGAASFAIAMNKERKEEKKNQKEEPPSAASHHPNKFFPIVGEEEMPSHKEAEEGEAREASENL
ncbi:hypothetical protein BHE74_00056065 [Ensete ventricosum]|uniref:Uncharacterized protein n=1 Tax=Ensete ventricosum TaxID=4639 RepID=A0A445MEQ5_ENSVE|nr:hypothetical protein BHE74_00056065 [Ensete ventricosum]RZR72686.1 hypothetical protein BHM03_00015851 [Ensete ventricosum]